MITGARIKDEISSLSRVVGSNKNIKTVFQGGHLQAYCSKDLISLPNIPNNAILDKDEARSLRGLADHESFHHAYTDLNMWAEASEYCEKVNDLISMRVWNGIEDPRIERLGVQEYKGTERNLSCTVKAWVDQINQSFDAEVPHLNYLPLKMAYMGRLKNGMEMNFDFHVLDKFNAIDLDEFIEPLLRIDDGTELVYGIADFLDSFGLPTLKNFLNGVPVGECQTPEQNKFKVTEMVEPDLDLICTSFTAETPYYGNEKAIYIYKTRRDGHRELDDRALNAVVQQFKVSLKTETRKRSQTKRQGLKLNSKCLVKAYNRADDIWMDKKGRSVGHDTAISFLIDGSGSMDNSIAPLVSLTMAMGRSIVANGIEFEVSGFYAWPCDYEDFRRDDMDAQPAGVVRAEALRIPIAKGFDEPLSRERMSGLLAEPMGRTPDSEALELALNRIVKRKRKRKILVMLTDGSPEFYRENVKINDKWVSCRSIALNHRKVILEQAKADGVEVYCIALGHVNTAHFNPNHVAQLNRLDSKSILNSFFNTIVRGAM